MTGLQSFWPPEWWPVVTRVYHSRHACAPLRMQGHKTMAVEDSNSFELKRPLEGMRYPFGCTKSSISFELVRDPGRWDILPEHKCRTVLTALYTSAQTISGTRVEAASNRTRCPRLGLVKIIKKTRLLEIMIPCLSYKPPPPP